MWGSSRTFGRGKVVENIIDCTSSCILNTGSHTHFNIASGAFSAIDLSICDPKSAPKLSWQTADDLHDSNHFPIIIRDNTYDQVSVRSYWRFNKANWPEFSKKSESLICKLPNSNNIDDSIKLFSDAIIKAALTHIGKTTISSRHKVVPWWNSQCELAIRQSKTALNQYRKHKSPENLIKYKKLKAKAKYVVKQSKKTSWHNYVSSLNDNTNPSQMWKKIRQVQGQKTNTKITHLISNSTSSSNSQIICNTLANTFEEQFHNKLKPLISSSTQEPLSYNLTSQHL
ncbi:uncharacterized protein [Diabrotica undecimpunctata]|uniref:uncharacterized protein n=1 Tax=Diabrotica undecimpunctata TaxID=50387 RepID=UPI003B6407F3